MKLLKLFFVIMLLLITLQLVAQNRIDSKYIVRTFIDEYGNSIDEIIVPGRPPKDFRAPIAEPTEATVALTNVPAFDWVYGCSATSAAMMAGHYDNTIFPQMYTGPTNSGVVPMNNSSWGSGECPLSATHQGYDGLAVRGHVDDYWSAYGSSVDPYYGNWTEHGYADCTADYMGTNQYHNWGNTDGATTFYNYTNGAPLYDYTGCEPTQKDGCHGLREFFNSRGYNIVFSGGNYQNYSQYIYGYSGNTIGFTYTQFKAEIDAGRPVLIQVEGHTMLGFGYETTSNTIHIHDTWDHNNHTMTWGGTYSSPPMQHYGVGVFMLEDPSITVTVPDGGESWDMGSTKNITWTSQYVSNVDIDLYNSGAHVMTIVGSQTASVGTFSWPIPTGLTPSSTYRIRISDSDASTNYDESDAYFTIYLPPPDPTDISIVNGSITQTQVGLTWSGTSPEFRVVRSTGGPASTPTSGTLVIEGAFTNATAPGLTTNTTYFFTVFGKNTGASQYSNGNQYLCAVTEAASGATTATVPTGQTGEITFGTTGSVIDITTNGSSAGTIASQKFDTAPSGNNTISGSATAPDASTVIPNVFSSERYWTITSTLTGSNTFTVYLDISGLSGVNDPDKLLILKRDAGGWVAQNTSRDGNQLYSNITSFSDFIIGADSGDNPLPVTLSSFTVVYYNGTPVINWTTQSESNNSGWNIYRSASSNAGQSQKINFELIPGAGTTSEPTEYSFIDEYETVVNQTYWYWLESVSGSGETETFGPVSLTIPFEEENTPIIPVQTKLWQNYPNPFNPNTYIKFDVKENETALLTIFNVKGQIILLHEFETGRHDYEWDAGDHGSGIYFYKLHSASYSQIKKMVLVK